MHFMRIHGCVCADGWDETLPTDQPVLARAVSDRHTAVVLDGRLDHILHQRIQDFTDRSSPWTYADRIDLKWLGLG